MNPISFWKKLRGKLHLGIPRPDQEKAHSLELLLTLASFSFLLHKLLAHDSLCQGLLLGNLT